MMPVYKAVCWGLQGEGWVGEDIQRGGGPWVPRVAPGLQD